MKMIPADPRFALATDAPRLAPQLASALPGACPDATWSRLSVVRVLPDGGGGFVVQYVVPAGDGSEYQLGALLPSAGTACPDWAGGDKLGRAWLPEAGLAVAVFPHDPELKRLPTVLTDAWRRGVAGKLGHDPADTRIAGSGHPTFRVLGYRLRKRCVVRLTLAARPAPNGAPATVVVKIVRPRRVAELAAAHRAIGTPNPGAAAFAVPGVLHVDNAHGALVMQDVPGRTLHSLIGTAGLPRLYAITGCALREFHRRPVNGASYRTSADEISQLVLWSRMVADMFPTLGGAPGRVLESLQATCNRLEPAPAPVLLHRDFYDKQVLSDHGTLTLLDLDTATAGDAALDIGNFLAHVRLRQMQLPQHTNTLAAAGNAFQEAYGPHHDLLARISWWRAAATLRLAALYALRPRWRSLTPKLLEEAETCLRQPERML